MLSRFAQLECFARTFEQGCREGDIVYHLLALIGFCRRAGFGSSERKTLRSVEVRVREALGSVIESLRKFVPTLSFDGWEVESLSEDRLVDLFEDRDSAELVFHLLGEYCEDEDEDASGLLRDLRRVLDRIDQRILLRRDLVHDLREIGLLEPVFGVDTEFFWWLGRPDHPCELPSPKRDEYTAAYVCGTLPQFSVHLANCPYCREAVADVEGEYKDAP